MTAVLSLAAANAMVAHAAELVVEAYQFNHEIGWQIVDLNKALAERKAVLAGMSASDASGTDAAKPQE